MRLDKFLSQSLSLTRQEAKHFLKNHDVLVGGVVTKNPATKLNNHIVTVDEKTLFLPKPTYLMLNKPLAVVCSTADTQSTTVIDIIEHSNKYHLHCAGRLDKDSTGLVLLTDDGKWSHYITSPKNKCPKRYRVTVKHPLDSDTLPQLEAGVLLNNDPKKTAPAICEPIDAHQFFITLTEGRYHQVKQMVAACGNRVISLHRQRIGSIDLGSLESGAYRELSPTEVSSFYE